MGAGIVLLFWIFLAVIFGMLWLSSLLIFLAGRRRKARGWSWIGGVPLALLSLFALVQIIGLGLDAIWIHNPANSYHLVFDQDPTPDVAVLQSYDYTFADTGVTYLHFTAAPLTIRSLMQKPWRLLPPENRADALHNISDDSPDWWQPKIGAKTVVYGCSGRQKSFASERELLIYDPVSFQAFYSFTGID